MGLYDRNPAVLRGRLESACVGIAGCGGLGSRVAEMLVRAGVGRLVLVDHDRIEESNLNRQFYFRDQIGQYKVEGLAELLRRIRTDIELELHPVRVTAGNVDDYFGACGILVEAFDLVESKALLMRAMTDEVYCEKTLVAASGLAGIGTANSIRTERLTQRIYICGDQQSDADVEGVAAPRVMLAAAHQANMVLRLLCGLEDC